MHDPYDLLSWGVHYREEALREASTRHLLRQTRANRRTRGERARASSYRASVMSPLRGGAKLSDASSLGGSSR
jgi:hypothetical protein